MFIIVYRTAYLEYYALGSECPFHSLGLEVIVTLGLGWGNGHSDGSVGFSDRKPDNCDTFLSAFVAS